MSSSVQFHEKFIAFVDILGFKAMVEAVEEKKALELSALLEYCSVLSQSAHVQDIAEYGPVICPHSKCNSRDLDYEVTQVSDCAVVSTEVSPAGLINLLQHVSACSRKLLASGVMLRGYVSRGNIYHKGNQIVGTGYQELLAKEREVKAFRSSQDKSATPFVEIDPAVVKYVGEETDSCVKEVFAEICTVDMNGIAAVFPFRFLGDLAASNIRNRDACRRGLGVIRKWITDFLERLELRSPSSHEKANQKSKYYRRFLREQLDNCNQMERLMEPESFPAHRFTPESFPALFRGPNITTSDNVSHEDGSD